MQYVDCDRAEKHGSLCLGYGYEEIDEPCEQCKNCIKCEGGYYQLGETDKDNRLTKAKEIIKDLLGCFFYLFEHDNKTRGHIKINNAIEQAEQFLKENGGKK